ncbi:MAG: sigma 54-interacting transcriptional regulator [bacterium]|nr:sigma 54-interacting transcriptional regulator [bacterium]
MLYEQRMTVEEAEAMLEVLEKPISTPVQPPKIDLTGKGEKARALMAKVLEAARTELPVLVEGEHGTGKALIARCIHQNSQRSQGPFLTVDSLVSPETLDVEIFGQEDEERKGLLDMADGGMLMLDSTHALTPETQHKLHSYLEHGYFTRLTAGREMSPS